MVSKKIKAIALSIILLANVAIAPLMQLASPVATERAPIAATNQTVVSDSNVAASSMGLFGLDTIWNGIKGFFNGIASFTQGMLEIGTCVAEWSGSGGGVLIAIAICPGLGLVQGITNVLVLIFENMFTVKIFTENATRDTMQAIHGSFTAIANIMFVIIFLLVIYSMLTSVGLSNYHIKKMAPKLAIVAIAVNMSFFICAILVDLSNFAGYGIKTFINSVTESAIIERGCNDVHEGDAGKIQTCIDEGGDGLNSFITRAAENVTVVGELSAAAQTQTMVIIMGIAIVVVVVMMLIAAVLVPILASIRMIMLIFLVVAAPIAFVLILHERTQSLFTKWFKAFGGLLIIFPAFGLFVGLSQVAVTIFYGMHKDAAGDPGGLFLGTIGVLVSIASPILFIKPLMKANSKLMAAASQKVNGVLKGAAAVGITAATMGAGAAVAGAGFGAKAMGALKAAPGIGGKLGHGIESFGKNSLRRGKNNPFSRLVARDAAHKRTGDHNERYQTAMQSGDEAWAQQAEMARHNDDVKDNTIAMAGQSDDVVLANLSKDKPAAVRQAAASIARERQIIDPKDPNIMKSLVTSNASLQDASAVDRAAALAVNQSVAAASQATYGDALVSGGVARDISLGNISSQEQLNSAMLGKFSEMSGEAIVGDSKAVKSVQEMAKTNADAAEKLVQAADSVIGANGAVHDNLSKHASQVNVKILQDARSPSAGSNHQTPPQ